MPSTTTTTTVIAPDRMRRLNFLQTNLDGGFVLLWVQSALGARRGGGVDQRVMAMRDAMLCYVVWCGWEANENEEGKLGGRMLHPSRSSCYIAS